MSLITLRQSIRDTIAEGVQDFAEVYMHGGKFGLAELKHWAVKTPCAVVGPLGIPSIDYEGQIVANVEWGAFVICKSTATMAREIAALAMVEALLSTISPLQRWDDELAHMPESIKAQNLYNADLDGKGVALWAITWTQGYDIVTTDFADLDNFLKFHSTITPSHDPIQPTVPAGDGVSSDTISLTGAD